MTQTSRPGFRDLAPLEVLWDEGGGGYPLPAVLAELYGGGFGFDGAVLYGNFVQSIDGVVALRSITSPAPLISGKSPADRFVMALLRACAEGVLVGAGTMRDTPIPWTARAVFPELADEFAALRRALGMRPDPDLLLLTATGQIDAGHPALHAGARVLTTEAGARQLGTSLPPASTVHVLPGTDALDISEAVRFFREQGYGRILSEAGPKVTGQLVECGLLDELFVTVSPVLAGGIEGDAVGLAEGVRMLPGRRQDRPLLSVRRHGSYLFLRYGPAQAPFGSG